MKEFGEMESEIARLKKDITDISSTSLKFSEY